MGNNLGTELDSGNSPMNEGDWLVSPTPGKYTLKLIRGELTVFDSLGHSTQGLGNGPHFVGDICTMAGGGELTIGPRSNWRSGTQALEAKLRIDDDGVPRIYDAFGNVLPIRR